MPEHSSQCMLVATDDPSVERLQVKWHNGACPDRWNAISVETRGPTLTAELVIAPHTPQSADSPHLATSLGHGSSGMAIGGGHVTKMVGLITER
jgi:hypothetical protein